MPGANQVFLDWHQRKLSYCSAWLKGKKEKNINNQHKNKDEQKEDSNKRAEGKEIQEEENLLAAVKEDSQIIMKTWISLRGEKNVSSKKSRSTEN